MKTPLPTLIKTVLLSTFAAACLYISFKEPPMITEDNSRLLAKFAELPLSFIPNQGQSANQVKYISKNLHHSLFFTDDQIVISLLANQRSHNLALSFLGASKNTSLTAEGLLASKTNYFIGNNPTQWQTNIANYSTLRYQDLYPGIDLVFYGNSQKFEYDFCVAPGANPNLIQLKLDHHKELALNADGDLHIITPEDLKLIMQKPYVYQVVNGEKISIDASFTLLAASIVGFKVASYNPELPLIIDPILSYSTYFGGTASDQINKITVDSSGNVYAVGTSQSTDLPVTAGAFQTVSPTIPNAFVLKLNPTGTALVFSTYLGGSLNDTGSAIQIDSSENVYVAGMTTSINFPTTAGVFQPAKSAGANSDCFLTKLSPTGSSLIYSTYFGGTGNDATQGLALDSAGNAYITGSTQSANLPVTVGAPQAVFGGGAADAFITKFNTTATALIYSTYLGGSGNDTGTAIALDSSDNAYVTGLTTSANFPSINAFQPALSGTQDAFITQINAAGTQFLFSTYFGGSTTDLGTSIAVGSDLSIYLLGNTQSSDFPVTPGAYQTTKSGAAAAQAAFVTKFTPNATALSFSTYLQGTAISVQSNVIKLAPSGNIYVAGATDNGFPVTSDAIQATYGGSTSDGFFTILNPTGSALVFSTYLGGTGTDIILGMALDSAGNAYLGGATSSTNFPVTAGAFQPAIAGLSDGFLAKIQFESTLISLNPNAGPEAGGTTVIITGTNFTGASQVLFGGVSAAFTVDSDSQITAIAPAGTGIVDVVVVTPAGQTATSDASKYAYVAFGGIQVWEKFATQTDVINILTWDPLDFGFAPTTVKIFRDPALTVLVATLPGTQTKYEDHNRKKYTTYTYYLVAYNSAGVPSAPIVTTVLPKKG